MPAYAWLVNSESGAPPVVFLIEEDPARRALDRGRDFERSIFRSGLLQYHNFITCLRRVNCDEATRLAQKLRKVEKQSGESKVMLRHH